MALDYMAIISNGTYPTPTPTGTERAAYAISYGLLGVIPTGTISASVIHCLLKIGKAGIRFAGSMLRIG